MRPSLVSVLVALIALASAGCASQAVTVPTTIKAPPQTARLDWKEQYPSTNPSLVFGVSQFTVTRDGWKADISVENTSNIGWIVGDPRFPSYREFGVLLFRNDDLKDLERRSRDGDVPGLRAATSTTPSLPETIKPGETWRGTIAAPGALAGGLWVRIAFGPFSADGKPPEDAQTPVVWYTDHAYKLEAVEADPA
ncbi:MAG: hypothetical protein LH654_02660 [Thermoleophilia bacterium]|nr:hypothetical protein [Thermoleophilia bacterium]